MPKIKHMRFLFVFIVVFVFSQSGVSFTAPMAFAYSDDYITAIDATTPPYKYIDISLDLESDVHTVVCVQEPIGNWAGNSGLSSLYYGAVISYPSAFTAVPSIVFNRDILDGTYVYDVFPGGAGYGYCSAHSGYAYTGIFVVSSGLLVPPASCLDGIQNQDETGIDVGGTCTVLSSEKAITSFSFKSLTPNVDGMINEADHTIALTVPFGTNIAVLVPSITISSGASINPNNNVAQNFTNTATYTVTAEDGSTQVYTVTMVVATHTPVLIIPGVLGTEISKTKDNGELEKLWLDLVSNLTSDNDDFMDPLQFNSDLIPTDASLTIGDVIGKATIARITFDYSDGLIKEFQNQGYTEGTDLFLFPYDWRYGVSEDTVNKLKQKISDILKQTGAEKVDVIAHSTGGLLAKKYVMENPANNHIDKAIFVGVPNTGAPKAVKALIEGDQFGNYLVADSEMKKISQNLPVAYDLLPSQKYFDIKGSFIKVITQNGFPNTTRDLDFDQANSFLNVDHQLNGQALMNAQNLHTADFDNYDLRTAGVNLYAIDGCKAGTIGKFIETRYQNLLGGNPSTTYTLEDTPGDGTVPLESSTNLPIDENNKFYALKSNHGEMLSQNGIRQEIVNLISGSSLDIGNKIITQDISQCKLNGRAVSVYSPLSIDIVDQDGNHSGLTSDGSIENNIPNADFEIIGEHKFVYLPTDEGQTYTISVAGTGTGTFTLTDATIDQNNITQTQVFSDISVTPKLLGHINLSSTTSLSLDTDGDGITDQTLEPTSVLDAKQSQNFIPEPKKNISAVASVNGGGPLLSGISQINTVVEKVPTIPILPISTITEVQKKILAEVPKVLAENPIVKQVVKQKNNSVVTFVKKVENTSIAMISHMTPEPIIKTTQKENNLTANVADTKVSTSTKVILGGFAGVIFIIFVAKKFIKV